MPILTGSTDNRDIVNKLADILAELRLATTSNSSAEDTLERIQQQLGQVNNDNNLEPGERFVQ